MPDRYPSRTALATAYLRAAHQILEAQPRILEDPVALRLLGASAAERIRGCTDRYMAPEAMALRAHVVLRSRYAEDRLAEAVPRGITQYVILGAGFDTFALRQPAWAASLRILEVDHPGTQELKGSRLAAAGLGMPGNAAFAHVDFEHESLHAGLLRHGISLSEPTFFSWLGVTMYLSEAAIDAVLASIVLFPPGSEVVLTFLQPPQARSDETAATPANLAQRVADLGEPFVSRFEPQAMTEKLRGAGFGTVGLLAPEDAVARYFEPRPTDLPLPRKTEIAWAIR